MSNPTNAGEDRWIAFVAVLPTEDPSSRMRILRTLEALGAALLREGVYLLPDRPGNQSSLNSLKEHVTRLNGSAHVLCVTSQDSAQRDAFVALFDRKSRYEHLRKDIESLQAGVGRSDPESIAAILARQRNELQAIELLDFFKSPEQQKVAQALDNIERQIKSSLFPAATPSRQITNVQMRFTERIWATRVPLWTDRLASAWLIRRYIDKGGQIVCLERDQRCPASAIGFGFDGAQFCNSSSQVTYEALLAHFGLEKRSPLKRIGELVRCLHGNGPSIAEAAGVEKLIDGARRRANTPEDLIAECDATFDLLNQAYTDPAEKTAEL